MEITQEGRILSVETPKPYDYLLIKGYEAEEAISELFSIDVQLAHKEADAESRQPTIIDPKELLGGEITIAVEQRDGTKRHFHGICNRFGQGDRDADFTYYDITVVPSIWVLTQRVRSRIFQHKTVKDILAAVLEGFNFKDETQGEFKPRNYCVQYRESDFNFISRLMEEEGIFYYFVHTQNSDQMIIANTPQSHRDCPGGMEVQYEAKIEGDGEVQKGAIRSLTREFQLRPGKVTLWDYNFQLPTNQLDAVSQTQVPMDGNAAIEFYDYPGSYARKYDGIDRMGGEKPSDINNLFEEKQKIADIAMQAIDARIAEIQMTTDFGGIAAGHRFKLKNHPDAESNKQYVVTSISHSAQQSPDYISESEEGTPVNASFYCIMHGAGKPQFRPEWKTPKPTVHGAQTAVVVGPPGEEIFTDKYGRVKVKFHWDREGKAQDGDTSCWVRVAKDLSGNKWGSMHIPRVGQEVIVDFLEGDPDQPIIVGTVYNPETMPHYELPKYKTLTYLKTHSTPKQNGYSGYNELRFEDKSKKEQIFMRAQRRMDLRVRGSLYETCGGNRHEVIGYKVDEKYDGQGGTLCVSVGGEYNLHVKGDTFIGLDSGLYEGVKADVAEEYKGNQQTFVTSKVEVNAREIVLEGSMKVTLKVGSSCVIVDMMGITIQGPMVKINSGGAAAPTGPMVMADPVDAEYSDNGEPGYLDKPRRGGGGGGHRWRAVPGQHAPSVAYHPPSGTNPAYYAVGGEHLRIEGNDTFVGKALADQSILYNTPTGRATIDAINAGTHNTTIREIDPAVAPSVGGGQATRVNDAGSTTPGVGSDTIIEYDPDYRVQYTDQNNNTVSDVPAAGVGHEMIHAVHNDAGTNLRNNAEPAEPGSNQEESQTIGIHGHENDPMTENALLDDLGAGFHRTDHDSTVKSL